MHMNSVKASPCEQVKTEKAAKIVEDVIISTVEGSFEMVKLEITLEQKYRKLRANLEEEGSVCGIEALEDLYDAGYLKLPTMARILALSYTDPVKAKRYLTIVREGLDDNEYGNFCEAIDVIATTANSMRNQQFPK